MAKYTALSWANFSWNPWTGCNKKDDGCTNCYMYLSMARMGKDPTVVTRAGASWNDPLKWQRKAAADGVCERVISCTMGDFFHAVADPWRSEAWDMIRNTPNLIYFLLTKRPERITQCLPEDWASGYANVWIGASVSCKRDLGKVDVLRKVPINPLAGRFLCCGPLLEDIADDLSLDGIGWVDLGGETGPGEESLFDSSRDLKPEFNKASGRRTMKIAWAQRICDKVKAEGKPFWFAQISSRHRSEGMNALGQLWREVPPPPGDLPWRERDETEVQQHVYSIEQLASLDESGHPTCKGAETETKLEESSNLRVELAAIEVKITGAGGSALTADERLKLEERRELLVSGFQRTRTERGKLLSEYRECFRKENRTWMRAVKLIADAEGCSTRTINLYIKDFKAAAAIPETVQEALRDVGIDAAKNKYRPLIGRITNRLKSSAEPRDPNKEQAAKIVTDEMKLPIASDLTDVSEPLSADEKLLHRIRKGIRQAVANIPIPKRLDVIKDALEEEMWMNWDQKKPITITLTPYWTPITSDGRKLKSDDRTQEVAA